MEFETLKNLINAQPTKEAKLELLLDNIWLTLYQSYGMRQLEADKFKYLVKEYATTSFDIDAEKVYFVKNIPNAFGRNLQNNKGVEIDNSSFQFNGAPDENVRCATKLIETISHELTHFNDDRSNTQNNIPADPRLSKGNYYVYCLEQLAKLHPEKSTKYEALGSALYATAQNEVLARNVAISFTTQLVEKLQQKTLQNLPLDNFMLDRRNKCVEFLNNGVPLAEAMEKANYSFDDDFCVCMFDCCNIMKTTIEDKKAFNLHSMIAYQQDIANYLPEARQDFYDVCNNYLDKTCIEEDIAKFPPWVMSVLMRKSEFYDKELTENLYKDFKAQDFIGPLGELSKIEDLDISEREREENIKDYEQALRDFAKRHQEQQKQNENQFHI